jgi:hypothetical protein
VKTELHPAEDIGVHRIADHRRFVGREAEFFPCGAHHDRTGLADAERFESGRRFEHGNHRAAPRSQTAIGRTTGIEIGGDEFRSSHDHPDGRFDEFQIEGASFSDHDVIRIMIDDRITVLMERVEQAAFADDIGRSMWLLLRQKSCCRHGTGENMLLFDVDAHTRQLGDDVSPRALTVVRQQAKWNVLLPQIVDEVARAGDDIGTAMKNAIHINEVTVLVVHVLQTHQQPSA